VRVVDVRRRYRKWALRGLVVKGIIVIYGLGKSTLVKILAVPPIRGRVGDRLSVRHPIMQTVGAESYAGTLGVERREVVEMFGLGRYLRVKFLSYGWRRRVDLAGALLGRLDTLLLREPMLGLCQEGRRVAAGDVRSFRGPVLVTALSMCDCVEEGGAWFELRGGVLAQVEPICGRI